MGKQWRSNSFRGRGNSFKFNNKPLNPHARKHGEETAQDAWKALQASLVQRAPQLSLEEIDTNLKERKEALEQLKIALVSSNNYEAMEAVIMELNRVDILMQMNPYIDDLDDYYVVDLQEEEPGLVGIIETGVGTNLLVTIVGALTSLFS